MTPHEQMMKWDKEGTAYWIATISMANGETETDVFDVMSHSEDWLRLRRGQNIAWVSMKHVQIIRFETEAGDN